MSFTCILCVVPAGSSTIYFAGFRGVWERENGHMFSFLSITLPFLSSQSTSIGKKTKSIWIEERFSCSETRIIPSCFFNGGANINPLSFEKNVLCTRTFARNFFLKKILHISMVYSTCVVSLPTRLCVICESIALYVIMRSSLNFDPFVGI